jgi:hypothetical protein
VADADVCARLFHLWELDDEVSDHPRSDPELVVCAGSEVILVSLLVNVCQMMKW